MQPFENGSLYKFCIKSWMLNILQKTRETQLRYNAFVYPISCSLILSLVSVQLISILSPPYKFFNKLRLTGEWLRHVQVGIQTFPKLWLFVGTLTVPTGGTQQSPTLYYARFLNHAICWFSAHILDEMLKNMKENSEIEVQFKSVQDVVYDIELCNYHVC